MEPEEYQQTMREVWSGAAKLSGVLVLIVLSPVLLWAVVQFCYLIIRVLDARGIRLPDSTIRWVDLVAVLVRWDWIRWRVALAGAAGTLAIGVTAGVLQLDGQRWLRTGRFWCRSPKELDARLNRWAGGRPEFPHDESDLRARVARQRRRRDSGRDTGTAKPPKKPKRKKKR